MRQEKRSTKEKTTTGHGGTTQGPSGAIPVIPGKWMTGPRLFFIEQSLELAGIVITSALIPMMIGSIGSHLHAWWNGPQLLLWPHKISICLTLTGQTIFCGWLIFDCMRSLTRGEPLCLTPGSLGRAIGFVELLWWSHIWVRNLLPSAGTPTVHGMFAGIIVAATPLLAVGIYFFVRIKVWNPAKTMLREGLLRSLRGLNRRQMSMLDSNSKN